MPNQQTVQTLVARAQQRVNTAVEWINLNPILRAGEIGVESDSYRIKIGNGGTTWNDLPYEKHTRFTYTAGAGITIDNNTISTELDYDNSNIIVGDDRPMQFEDFGFDTENNTYHWRLFTALTAVEQQAGDSEHMPNYHMDFYDDYGQLLGTKDQEFGIYRTLNATTTNNRTYPRHTQADIPILFEGFNASDYFASKKGLLILPSVPTYAVVTGQLAINDQPIIYFKSMRIILNP